MQTTAAPKKISYILSRCYRNRSGPRSSQRSAPSRQVSRRLTQMAANMGCSAEYPNSPLRSFYAGRGKADVLTDIPLLIHTERTSQQAETLSETCRPLRTARYSAEDARSPLALSDRFHVDSLAYGFLSHPCKLSRGCIINGSGSCDAWRYESTCRPVSSVPDA